MLLELELELVRLERGLPELGAVLPRVRRRRRAVLRGVQSGAERVPLHDERDLSPRERLAGLHLLCGGLADLRRGGERLHDASRELGGKAVDLTSDPHGGCIFLLWEERSNARP
jgi:hypothetical protein